MKAPYRMFIIAVLVVLLACIRLFETSLFYDPLICFFKEDYLNNNIPMFENGPLLWNVFLRFWMNTLISLLIIYVAFFDKNIVKFSFFLYSILFVGCMSVFVIFILNIEQKHFLSLFYLRRFLIHPLFILILLPAFYYYRLKDRNAKRSNNNSGNFINNPEG